MAQENCLISAGRPLQCFIEAGIDNVWLANFNEDAVFTLDPSTNIITGVTSANTAFTFSQDTEYAGLAAPGVHEQLNGATSRDVVLSLKFIDLNADLLTTLQALSKAALTAYIQSNAGTFYVLGATRPGRVTASEAGLGTSLSDMNGSTLDITWKSILGIQEMDGTLLGTSIPVSA